MKCTRFGLGTLAALTKHRWNPTDFSILRHNHQAWITEETSF
jgi:hypothetical protein